MKLNRTQHRIVGQPPEKAPLRLRDVVVMLPCVLAIGLAVGWLATVAGMRFAPFVIFPLAVGVVLGMGTWLAAKLLQTGHRKTILSAALAAAGVAIFAQHYFSYAESIRNAQESPQIKNAQQALPELMRDRLPTNLPAYLRQQAAIGRAMPVGYVARGPMAWLSWAFDGLLIIIAAALTVKCTAEQKEQLTEIIDKKK